MHHTTALLLAAATLLLLLPASALDCTAEDTCVSEPVNNRCLQTHSGGAPCTLDYAFNETGFCSCQAQSCVALTAPPKSPSKLQLLAIGDSISDGYLSALSAALQPAGWEVTHAPSFGGSDNNDNAHWHQRCNVGWLGSNASRWDAITMNAGLHDLAFPDNEHLNVTTYASLLAAATQGLLAAVPSRTKLIWLSTTPVPTNPTPACLLLPGRLEGEPGGAHPIRTIGRIMTKRCPH